MAHSGQVPKEKTFPSPLELTLFKALEAMNSAFWLMQTAAGDKAKFTIEDADKISRAKQQWSEAIVAFGAERMR